MLIDNFVAPKSVFASGKRRGRPPSNMANQLEQQEKAQFKILASKRARKIIDSQTVAAYGTYHIVALSYDADGVRHQTIVRDEKRQASLLEKGLHGTDYMIIEGTPPDWRAGDAILNRAWGKPAETQDVNIKHTLVIHALGNAARAQPVDGEVLRVI